MLSHSNSPRKISRLSEVTEAIREMANSAGAGAKLPTIVELRRDLGASISTLSGALQELESSGVIYRRHSIGIFVSPSFNTRKIRVLLDARVVRAPGVSPFWGTLWGLLADEAKNRSGQFKEECIFQVVESLLHSDLELAHNLLSEYRVGRLHGILCVGLQENLYPLLKNEIAPIVGFGGHFQWFVETDGARGLRMAVNELAKQGCVNVGLWHHVPSFVPPLPGNTEREVKMFRQALSSAKLAFQPHLLKERAIVENGVVVESGQEQGYQLALEVFGASLKNRVSNATSSTRSSANIAAATGAATSTTTAATKGAAIPDGLVITHDLMTDGALLALQELNMKAGRDVKIATFGNQGSVILFRRASQITIIEYNTLQIARSMFDMLETLMSGQTPPRRERWISPQLHPTKSTS